MSPCFVITAEKENILVELTLLVHHKVPLHLLAKHQTIGKYCKIKRVDQKAKVLCIFVCKQN